MGGVGAGSKQNYRKIQNVYKPAPKSHRLKPASTRTKSLTGLGE